MDNDAWDDAWIIQRNVSQYRQLLQFEQDEAWRGDIMRLLTQAEGELAEMKRPSSRKT
jgi:hypothetical protein